MKILAVGLLAFLTVSCNPTYAQKVSAEASASTSEIEIVSAVYGDLENKVVRDVTKILSGRIEAGKLRFEVDNDVLGDPAEGTSKTLHVKYKLNGQPLESKTKEGETLLIPTPKLEGKLVVIKAVYGDLLNELVNDVTEQVQRMVEDNALEVEVSNDWFEDPASGTFKRLRVEYKIGDVKLAKSTWENGTLKITVPTADEKK